MNLPTIPWGVTNVSGLIDWLRTLSASIAAGWVREHHADGTHGDVTATSLTTTEGVFERGRAVAMGEFVTPPFSAGDFTSTGVGTAWGVDSGDVITYAYALVGNLMTVLFDIRTTDVTGTPSTLNLVIPGGYSSVKETRTLILAVDAGAADIGQARVQVGATVIECFTDLAATAWTATAGDNTRVTGQIQFEVQ